MTNQERNREALIDHIAEQDRIIRLRNEQIVAQVAITEETRRDLAEFQTMHTRQIETIARLQENTQKAEKERDEAVKSEREVLELGGRLADALNDELDASEQPRPLTADDGMLSRAVLEARKHRGTCDAFHSEVQAIVNAALTEPPSRPEGAEEIERLLTEGLGDFSPPATPEAVADLLAERGVRVTGGQS